MNAAGKSNLDQKVNRSKATAVDLTESKSLDTKETLITFGF